MPSHCLLLASANMMMSKEASALLMQDETVGAQSSLLSLG